MAIGTVSEPPAHTHTKQQLTKPANHIFSFFSAAGRKTRQGANVNNGTQPDNGLAHSRGATKVTGPKVTVVTQADTRTPNLPRTKTKALSKGTRPTAANPTPAHGQTLTMLINATPPPSCKQLRCGVLPNRARAARLPRSTARGKDTATTTATAPRAAAHATREPTNAGTVSTATIVNTAKTATADNNGSSPVYELATRTRWPSTNNIPSTMGDQEGHARAPAEPKERQPASARACPSGFGSTGTACIPGSKAITGVDGGRAECKATASGNGDHGNRAYGKDTRQQLHNPRTHRCAPPPPYAPPPLFFAIFPEPLSDDGADAADAADAEDRDHNDPDVGTTDASGTMTSLTNLVPPHQKLHPSTKARAKGPNKRLPSRRAHAGNGARKHSPEKGQTNELHVPGTKSGSAAAVAAYLIASQKALENDCDTDIDTDTDTGGATGVCARRLQANANQRPLSPLKSIDVLVAAGSTRKEALKRALKIAARWECSVPDALEIMANIAAAQGGGAFLTDASAA